MPHPTDRTRLRRVHQRGSHDPQVIHAILDATRRFHDLPLETKRSILIDRPEHHVGGVGYMPVGTRKLPTRERGNPNEAFLVKSDRAIGFDDNLWLPARRLRDPFHGNLASRRAISSAACAASAPLFPTLPPERWIACSNVLHVSNPNRTGTPVSIANWPKERLT